MRTDLTSLPRSLTLSHSSFSHGSCGPILDLVLTALIPAARRADRNSRPRGGVQGILGPNEGFSGANVQCSYCAHTCAGGAIRECFRMRSDLRRGSPFPDIFEELPVGKRSLTQNQHSYLKLHVVAALGSLNYSVLRKRERFPPYSDRA